MFYVVINSINLLFTGIAVNFLSKGLPWLGFTGIYIEYASPLSCKLSRFLQTFLNCSLINILLCEVIGRLIYLLSYGAHSPDLNFIIYILAGALFSSFFLCFPMIILYNLQKPDGRYDCIPDPEWPYVFIRWHAIHRMIFCDGLMQSLIILVLNGFIVFQLLKFRWTIASIQSFFTESNIVSDTLKQVIRLLNNNARDSILVVIHSTFVVLLFFVRSIVSYVVHKVIFIDFLDNTTVDGALLNYKWTAVEDFLTFLHILFISCYMWLYFFIIPTFRTYIRKSIKRISRKNQTVLRIADLFMLTDNEMAESPEVWKKSQDHLGNLDSVLFERVHQLEGALKYNSNQLLLKSHSQANESNKYK
uniref:GCR137 n=1 Tax=Schmidtea mediterranea TaxID=79327 RepID=A0A193KUU2_SCHMD|nr:GCR137 [Schmidtea mediterranea]